MLRIKHAERLLKFEMENRQFFETIVPSRGEEYYHLDYIKKIIRKFQPEMLNNHFRLYVIIDEESEAIIGRINLFNIEGGVFNKGEIGYRIAKDYCNKGVATEAVKWAVSIARDDLKLHRLEAGCAVENIGSQIVLIKNSFHFVGRTHQVIKVGDYWQDGFAFEKIL